MVTPIPLSLYEEHRFWLELLRDHTRFVLDRLCPSEREWAVEVAGFGEGLRQLSHKLDTLQTSLLASAPEWIRFAKDVFPIAAGYYNLEGKLMAERLNNRVQLLLPPSFLNGSLNENQEYMRRLRCNIQGAHAPELDLWSLMDLWLNDQYNHVRFLQAQLGPEADTLTEEYLRLAVRLQNHLLLNKHHQGFLRFTPAGFPEQLELARDAADTIIHFCNISFEAASKYMIPEGSSSGSSGSSTLLLLDHQLREASYFLNKLARWIPSHMNKLSPSWWKQIG